MNTTPNVIPGRFSGRTAIVTGAGAGIGRATAERLAREGARVIATDVSAPRIDELLSSLAGLEVVGMVADVADPATPARLVEAADGRVDLLANVAGIMDGFLPTAELDDETWERVFAVNVTAVMRLSRAVLPLMLAAGSGSIVNVSSEASFRASASGTAYSASKHAVNGLTRSTAFFYSGTGVRVNAVAPGAVATSIEAPFRSQFAGERLGPFMQVNVPAAATSEELAAAITWLLSDDSANVNGVVLASDGGWSAV
jgi:NAD(P)-dependent dehydrogenase (short-subunit alcohol dehydrogenase family)